MELELSLGDASSKPFAFMEKSHRQVSNKGLAFSMGLGLASVGRDREEEKTREAVVDVDDDDDDDDDDDRDEDDDGRDQTQRLLPLLPVSRAQASHQALPWPSDNGNHIHMPPNHKRVFFLGFLFLFGFFVLGGGGDFYVFSVVGLGSSEAGSSGNVGLPARGLDVNRLPYTAAAAAAAVEELEDGAAAEVESSPNSAASSFQMDFCIYRGGNGGNKRDFEGGEAERGSSRASDEDDNGLTRKKLRLSKEQSAFLEESFKEHNTLNPVSISISYYRP